MAFRDRDSFAQSVMADFRTRRSLTKSGIDLSNSVTENLRSSRLTTGHPEFADLSLGQSGHCAAVAMFIDLENFTGRTFWDPPADVVSLAQAVLGQIAEIVTSFGGYVLGLRGDRLFASFGQNLSSSKIDAGLAMAAGATALDSVQGALNNLLILDGLEPVQLRVGADFGRLDFVRCGSNEVSEINVIGFAANFAAKCEKYANSWEFVIGEALQDLIDESDDWCEKHHESPKDYQRNYERRHYHFYDVRWKRILPYARHIPEELAGSASSSVSWK